MESCFWNSWIKYGFGLLSVTVHEPQVPQVHIIALSHITEESLQPVRIACKCEAE